MFTADFETTTDEKDCRVWAWAVCDINKPDNISLGNSIESFFSFLQSQGTNTYYFHNLKFDGEFIIYYLLKNGFKHIKDKEDRGYKTFETLITDRGVFYQIKVYFSYVYRKPKQTCCITFVDSFKLLPFSVEAIAKSFDLPISKLEIDYNANREVGHILTLEEQEYIKNDVKIMALALNEMFIMNLTKMTIGSCALNEYKDVVGLKKFERNFPIPDYDQDIRRSYRGGFTYLNPKFKDVDVGAGIVLDVNSLYPSVMFESKMPYGTGIYFKGKYQSDVNYDLYVCQIMVNFDLKTNHIPTIQLKNTLGFQPTEYVESSNGEKILLTLTNVDLDLFFQQYNVYEIDYLSGWKFKSSTNLFKPYINKWNAIKAAATVDGDKVKRTIAKLMLNNLYGKFATNPKTAQKYPKLGADDMVHYVIGDEEERDPVYIPVGTFVTAWARYKTITSAQKLFDRFIYADTDSLHLVGTELPDCLEIHDTKLGAWKHESSFVRARFLRSKSYIEDDGKELKITCAGMPKGCYSFVTWENFHPNASYPGKLKSTRVSGGIILKESPHTLRA